MTTMIEVPSPSMGNGGGSVSQADELKQLLEPTVTASMLAHRHLLLVSSPGYGKTEILQFMGEQVFGKEHSLKFSCVPSSLPSDVMGFKNPVYAIDPEAEQKGLPRWISEDTPVDAKIEYCLFDELTRFGDLGTDSATHTMHRISSFHVPVYVATANWLTPTPRNAALRDRFSFTIFYVSSPVDVDGLMDKPDISTWKFQLPTREDCAKVRQWHQEYITAPDRNQYKCHKVMKDLVNTIQKLCETDKHMFQFNNRLVFNLRSILYSMGTWIADSPDFTEIPRMASEALMYSYPVTSLDESLWWRAIIGSTIDIIETELNEFKANIYARWQEIRNEKVGRRGTMDQATRDVLGRELAKSFQEQEAELKQRFGNDPRVDQTLREMQGIYMKIVSGEDF